MADKGKIKPYHSPERDITVILDFHLEDSLNTIIGILLEISPTSLIFEYLCLDNYSQALSNIPCTAILKIREGPKSGLISVQGCVEFDEPSPNKSFFGLHYRQCKVVFAGSLSDSQMKILSL